ncbi:MAG: flagellar assembly protein FliX [Pseudomonadota bacterium]|nr:flagellar assembly protein FliX [Pseudomonadota bacterium]
MKIEKTSPIGSSPVKRGERSGKTAAGKFSKQVGAKETLSVDPVSGAAPVQGVDALLAIQEVEDLTADGRNARGRYWGEELLDRLESIRLGLLAGGIPASELRNISNLLTSQREAASDPRLQEILEEIELRARVELAKYEVGR